MPENHVSTQAKNSSLQRVPILAQEFFKSAKPEYQTLIRDILKEERDVMHLQRRNDIHQRLYDHIKRVIK
jgi:hypothetical protein